MTRKFTSEQAAITAILKTLDEPRAPSTEARAIDAILRLYASNPREGLVFLWHAFRTQWNELTQRTVAFVLAQDGEHDSRYWVIPILDFLTPPYSNDPSTLINVLSALRRHLREFNGIPESAIYGLVGFARHCLRQVPLVRDAAIDLLAMIGERGLAASWFTQQQIGLLNNDLADLIQSQGDELEFVVDDIDVLTNALRDVDARDIALVGLAGLRELLADLQEQASVAAPARAARAFADAARFVEDQINVSELVTSADELKHPIQEIHIAMNDAPPGFDLVNTVLESWRSLFGSALAALAVEKQIGHMFPIGTRSGSFVLRVAIAGAPHASEAFESCVALMSHGADANRLSESFQKLGIDSIKYQGLLETLKKNKASVRISMVNMDAIEWFGSVSLTDRDAQAAIEPARTAALMHLDSSKIPQADELERLFKLIHLVHTNDTIYPDNAMDKLGVVYRQVNYYRQAARLLGLMSDEGALTRAGEQIARIDLEKQLMATAIYFENSDCGAAWIRWSGVSSLADVRAESSRNFLRDVAPDLAPETCRRRSQTLSLWHKRLTPYHYSRWHS